MNNLSKIKTLLDQQIKVKNCDENLALFDDPISVAKRYNDVYISLICALFAYGNAKQIVKFLNSLDFELLSANEEIIKKELKGKIYRFQNEKDVQNIFITLKRLKDYDLQEIILKQIQKSGNIIDGVNSLIGFIYSLNSFKSDGYNFFFGSGFEKEPKSTYKRYNMYLRWMVRNSDIDLGLFEKISCSKLLLPLDVHTHKVSLALGLCTRKSYDFKSVMQITQNLREFDVNDPIKYDFALYRIGQSGEIETIKNNF